MEVGLMSSSSSSKTHSLPTPLFRSLLHRDINLKRSRTACCLFFSSNGFSSQNKLPIHGRDGRALVICGAKKRKNKPDSHSFVSKPDEATGPFPEAVLLKKKTVKEDGRVLPEFADAEEEKLFEFLSLQLESDLDVERMRHYEVVYLIHEDRVNEVDNVISKVEGFIREKKGRIWRLNNWGLRKLAYKIRKAKNANYILMNFEIEAKLINDFKSMLDKDERIIRHLVIKRDEAITVDCPPPLEFHTLRPQGMDDEEEEDVDGGDDDLELEMANYDDDADDIIFVDENEDNNDDGASRRARTSKAEKVAR